MKTLALLASSRAAEKAVGNIAKPHREPRGEAQGLGFRVEGRGGPPQVEAPPKDCKHQY